MERMVTKKPPKNQKTDKAQSKRFKDTARELETAGDLDLTEAEKLLKAKVRAVALTSKKAGVRPRDSENAD